MDSFFGIGLPELILILLLAGMVMGPQRIRTVARQLGRITAKLQGISRQFARQLNAELDALEGDDMKGAWNEVRQLQQEVQALRQEIGQAPKSFVGQSKELLDEAQQVFDGEPGGEESGSAEPATDSTGASSLPKALEIPDDPE